MKKILIVCAAALLLAVNAWADTVTFKSGKKVEGNIKSIAGDSVTVDLYGVTEMTYDLADIQDINGQAVETLKPTVAAETPALADQTSAPVEKIDVIAPSGVPQEEMPAPVMGELPKMNLSDKQAKTFLAALGMFFIILLFVLIILYIYSAICLQAIAKKTGTEREWMAWIPIANLFLMCNIGKVRYVWLLLLLTAFIPVAGKMLSPLCNLALGGYLWYMVALARGKQGWIGAITVLPVVGLFTMGYLAFSKDAVDQGAAPLPGIGGGQPVNPLGTTSLMKPPIE